MPTITADTSDEIDRARSISIPEEHQVAGSTWLTQCLYNIPPGVITVTLPGLSILITGVVLIALTNTATDKSSVADGLQLIAVVVVCVGGAWTTLALGFWAAMCVRHRLTESRKTSTSGSGNHYVAGRMSSVELVAVSWRDDALHSYGFQNTALNEIHYHNCVN